MPKPVEIDTKGLDVFIKMFKGKVPEIQIGILGENNSRSEGHMTNAEVGAIHEYGNSGHPMRSFLRVPISDNLQSYLESSGLFDKQTASQVMKDGKINLWLQKIAITAEKIVMDGFDSSGFGKWAPWKIPGYSNNTGQILLDSQQLRNSVKSEVK